jgi:hypothetical protein
MALLNQEQWRGEMARGRKYPCFCASDLVVILVSMATQNALIMSSTDIK